MDGFGGRGLELTRHVSPASYLVGYVLQFVPCGRDVGWLTLRHVLRLRYRFWAETFFEERDALTQNLRDFILVFWRYFSLYA